MAGNIILKIQKNWPLHVSTMRCTNFINQLLPFLPLHFLSEKLLMQLAIILYRKHTNSQSLDSNNWLSNLWLHQCHLPPHSHERTAISVSSVRRTIWWRGAVSFPLLTPSPQMVKTSREETGKKSRQEWFQFRYYILKYCSTTHGQVSL